MSLEGFVVRDKDFRRVKVKTPQYVALGHLNIYDQDNLNFGHMLRIVMLSEGSEFLTYFPYGDSCFS